MFKLRFVIKIEVFKRIDILETRNVLVVLITRIKKLDRFKSNLNKKSIKQKKTFNFDNISRSKRFDSQSEKSNRRASSTNRRRKKKTTLSFRDDKNYNNKNREDNANSTRTYYNYKKKRHIARDCIKSKKEKTQINVVAKLSRVLRKTSSTRFFHDDFTKSKN